MSKPERYVKMYKINNGFNEYVGLFDYVEGKLLTDKEVIDLNTEFETYWNSLNVGLK